MKKYLLAAMVIGLAFMTGCKKDSGTTSGGNDGPVDITDNYIYKQFRFAESLLGLDSATVDKMLADSGYTDGFFDGDMTYYNIDDTATCSVSFSEYRFDDIGSFLGVKGKSVDVGIFIGSSYLYNRIKQSDYLDFIKYIGKSYKMASGENCYFNDVLIADYTDESSEYLHKDYDSSINDFDYIYSMDYWEVLWGYNQTSTDEIAIVLHRGNYDGFAYKHFIIQVRAKEQ